MELATRASSGRRQSLASAELNSWLAEECEIGRRTYQGASDVVEVLEVTYQQKARTFGRFDGVRGVMVHGDGVVAGGGGFVDTTHQSVATVIVRDFEGAENTLELPAEVAARSASILRIDSINERMIAVTNLSGRGGICAMANSRDFLPIVKFTGWDTILAILCVLGCTANLVPLALVPFGFPWLITLGNCLIFIVLFGTKPALKIREIRTTNRQRRELVDYMNAITA